MNDRPRIWLSWSSGKDSAWALHVLRQRDDVEVAGLLTILNRDAERVAMHAVRESLLEAQAKAVGVPLTKVLLPHRCSNSEYEGLMKEVLERARNEGISAVAFGDLFLEDVRQQRERMMEETGLGTLFPLWGLETERLARDMVAAGVRALVTCVDPRQLTSAFAGRTFDDFFLDDLPKSADPCGERGEFHSFVYEGPMFQHPVSITPGHVVERDGFFFADVLPGESESVS